MNYLLFSLQPKPHPKGIWYYLLELFFLSSQAGSAYWQKMQIALNLPIAHLLWATVTGLMIIAMVWFYWKKTHATWWRAIRLAIALLLIRFIFFSPILNQLRGKPFFYTGKASLQDRLMGQFFPWIWATALAMLIYLQI